jgi:hypothetical protein
MASIMVGCLARSIGGSNRIYFAALVENSKINLRRANMESETWREAANETLAACEATLSDLNKHRAEHGC